MSEQYWALIGGMVTLAASNAAPNPDSMAQYGPWAVAFMLLLVAGKDIVLKALGKEPPRRGEDEPLRTLAHAVEKLAMVLERMERDQEKGQDEIRDILRSMERTLQGVDFRTKEIRDRIIVTGVHGSGDSHDRR